MSFSGPPNDPGLNSPSPLLGTVLPSAAGLPKGTLFFNTTNGELLVNNGSGSWLPLSLSTLGNLANGTSTLLTTQTPADGANQHLFIVAFTAIVTVGETGGATGVAWTSRGNALTAVLDPGGRGIGNFPTSVVGSADPGTPININQTSALTVGTAQYATVLSIF